MPGFCFAKGSGSLNRGWVWFIPFPFACLRNFFRDATIHHNDPEVRAPPLLPPKILCLLDPWTSGETRSKISASHFLLPQSAVRGLDNANPNYPRGTHTPPVPPQPQNPGPSEGFVSSPTAYHPAQVKTPSCEVNGSYLLPPIRDKRKFLHTNYIFSL